MNSIDKLYAIYENRKRVYSNVKYAKQMMKDKRLFQEIEIETVNRCNGKCEFCPVNANEIQRPYAKMSDNLFSKIIDELHELKFDGKVSIFSNNEPFLDERIVYFYQYAKNKLPNAYFNLFTNGSLLTVEKLIAILPYLDNLMIDNYNIDGISINSNLENVYEYWENHREIQYKVHFSVIQETAVRLSRGGQAPNKKDVSALDEVCILPFRQIVIRPTGEISLCCNDALGMYSMGDVSKKSLCDIWYSEKYTEIRKEMLKNHRKNLKLCNHCDTATIAYKS